MSLAIKTSMFSYLKLLILFVSWVTIAHGQSPRFDNTQKVSIIFVGPSKGFSESSFGHLALRFSPNEVPGLLDIVVEFVADVPENELVAKKYLKGIGIGGAYPVAAKIRSFHEFKKVKTIEEDRPLKVLELNLSKNQITQVTDFVADFRDRLVPDDYVFFTKNCSFFSALAIERATGRDLGIKSFPWKVPQKIIKEGLVEKEENFESASVDRMKYAERAIKRDRISDAFPKDNWAQTFVPMLGEFDFVLRQSSYLKLLWILQSEAASPKIKRKTNSLLRYLLSLETDAIQFVLKNLFENPEKKTVIEIGMTPFSSNKNEFKHELSVKNNSIAIDLSWYGMDDDVYSIQSVKHFRESFKLKDIRIDEVSQSMISRGAHLGRYIDTKTKRLILTQVIDYGLAIDKANKTMSAYLYIDRSGKTKSPKQSLEVLKSRGILALNNATDFKGELGSCYAMVLLQKAMMEKALFLPSLPRNEATDKISILNAVYDGQYAFVPGFENIQDFTRSIDKDSFKNFIRAKQGALQKNSLHQIYDNYKKRTGLNSKTIRNLKALVDEGLSVPVVIGALQKNKNKLADTSGHVILLFDLQDLGNGNYRLTAYDPNTGLNTLYTLDQNFKLQFPFYDKRFDYKGMIDQIPELQTTLDHAVRSRDVNLNLVETLLNGKNSLVIDSPLIYRFLD